MTFRERLAQERPDRINLSLLCGCEGCPDMYGYEDRSKCADVENCRACWDREIPLPPEDDAPAEAAPQELPQEVRKLVEARIQQLTEEVKVLEAEKDALCDWLNGVSDNGT